MENKEDVKTNVVNITELAKWGSIIMATITGSVLFSDWVYTLNYYGTLGALQLARPTFLSTPLHFSGFLSLWIGLLMVGFYYLSMVLLINLILKPIFRLIPRKIHVPILLLFTIFVFIAATMAAENLDTSSFQTEIIAVAPFLPVAPTTVMLWLVVKNYVNDNSTRNILLLGLILIAINFFFISFIVTFSSTSGKSDGEKILRGEKYLPIVAIVSKEKILFSEKITESQIADDRWLYAPQYVTNPQTGNTIATMQLIGADEKYYYILDLWGSSAQAISKDNIAQVIYYNFSGTALLNSGRNPIFLATPTP